MSFRIGLKYSLIALGIVLLLVLATFTIAPLLPGAGQIGFSAESTFYVLDVGRSIQHPLLASAAYPPQWSPDGEQVVYIQQEQKNEALVDHVMLADLYAPESQALYPVGAVSGAVKHLPAWSPFRSQIVFTFSETESEALELVVVEPDAARTQVGDVSGLLPGNGLLGWAAAGQLRYVVVGSKTVRLYTLGLDDLSLTLVQEWPFETMVTRPVEMSPDGTRFVLPAITPSLLNFEIYRFDIETGAVHNLSNRPLHNDTNAVWSPDGEHLLFRSLNDAGQFLVMMNADGSDQVTVYREKDALFSQVAWSPDGTQASFVAAQSNRKRLCILEVAAGQVGCPVRGADHASWRPAH